MIYWILASILFPSTWCKHDGAYLAGHPLEFLTTEAARVFRLLKRLPDERFVVWQRLAIWDQPGPDFWVLRSDLRSVLIKVATSTPAEARAALQGQLFEAVQARGDLGRRWAGALNHFARECAACLTVISGNKCRAILLCPNLEATDIAANQTDLVNRLASSGRPKSRCRPAILSAGSTITSAHRCRGS